MRAAWQCRGEDVTVERMRDWWAGIANAGPCGRRGLPWMNDDAEVAVAVVAVVAAMGPVDRVDGHDRLNHVGLTRGRRAADASRSGTPARVAHTHTAATGD
jgi:hypothetical protein